MLVIVLSDSNHLMSLKTLQIHRIAIQATDVPSGMAMKVHHDFFFGDKSLTSKQSEILSKSLKFSIASNYMQNFRLL